MSTTPQSASHGHDRRSERWMEGLRELATGRGDGEAVWRRAVDLTRQLNIAPWLALALAERLVTLKDVPLLDRASRCDELQAGVLDKRLSIAELRTTLPYAAHLLAVELVDKLGRADWELNKVTLAAEGLLGMERRMGADGLPLPVRTRSVEEYAEAVKRVRRLIERTGCSMPMALDVEAGRLTEEYVVQYARQRRRLVQDEIREMAPPRRYPTRDRDAGPVGRGHPFGASRGPRRPYVGRPFPPRPSEPAHAGTA